jgi:hypothetical protein
MVNVMPSAVGVAAEQLQIELRCKLHRRRGWREDTGFPSRRHRSITADNFGCRAIELNWPRASKAVEIQVGVDPVLAEFFDKWSRTVIRRSHAINVCRTSRHGRISKGIGRRAERRANLSVRARRARLSLDQHARSIGVGIGPGKIYLRG